MLGSDLPEAKLLKQVSAIAAILKRTRSRDFTITLETVFNRVCETLRGGTKDDSPNSPSAVSLQR